MWEERPRIWRHVLKPSCFLCPAHAPNLYRREILECVETKEPHWSAWGGLWCFTEQPARAVRAPLPIRALSWADPRTEQGPVQRGQCCLGQTMATSSDFPEEKPVIRVLCEPSQPFMTLIKTLCRPNKTTPVRLRGSPVCKLQCMAWRFFSLAQKYGTRISRIVLGLDDSTPVWGRRDHFKSLRLKCSPEKQCSEAGEPGVLVNFLINK